MNHLTLYLAGGCFWGVQGYFDQLKGVLSSSVGYIDGNMSKPTYELVCKGVATHAEAIEILVDLDQVSLDFILKHYIAIINPFSVNKQGNDIGIQYRTGIYAKKEATTDLINQWLKEYFKTDYDRVKVVVKVATDYVKAEAYHQDYLKKNPNGYCHIDIHSIPSEDKK